MTIDNLNMTTLATATPDAESHSSTSSPSLRRYGGSIFASALMAAWKEEAESAEEFQCPNRPRDLESEASWKQEIYLDLSRAV